MDLAAQRSWDYNDGGRRVRGFLRYISFVEGGTILQDPVLRQFDGTHEGISRLSK